MQSQTRLIQESPARWKIPAPAKLNLGLRVPPPPPRPDGFHDLETWMLPISLCDTLTIEIPPNPSRDRQGATERPSDSEKPLPHGRRSDETPVPPDLQLLITGRTEGIPIDPQKNLIGRAALALAQAAGIPPIARITLHKVVPPGGGLGGGSSDAASALLALNTAWNLHWPADRLEKIAATLGSDIPFFIQSTPSLCTGRGEIMSPLLPRHPLFAVLISPPIGCPTKAVYQAFDAGHHHHPPLQKTNWKKIFAAPADDLSAMLINDLEPAAFSVAPPLAEIRDHAARIIGQKIHMTGSGSTLFALCPSALAAGELTARLSAALDPACTCIPVRILPIAD